LNGYHLKRQKISVGDHTEKLKPLHAIHKMVQILENSEGSLKKTKHRIQSDPTSGYISKKKLKVGSQRDMWMPMFMAALFTRDRSNLNIRKNECK
jgi:hypothetical protein